MTNRWMLTSLAVVGMGLLAACTSVQTASERQTYFEDTSAAKLTWQPTSNVPTSFQGCSWDSIDYPCQPYSKLNAPKQDTTTSLKPVHSTNTPHKQVSHKKKEHHVKVLPLCQPVSAVNPQGNTDENHSVQLNQTNT